MLSEQTLSLLKLQSGNATAIYLAVTPNPDGKIFQYHEVNGIAVTVLDTITQQEAGSLDNLLSLRNFIIDQIQSKDTTVVPDSSIFSMVHSSLRLFKSQHEYELIQLMKSHIPSISGYPLCWSAARDYSGASKFCRPAKDHEEQIERWKQAKKLERTEKKKAIPEDSFKHVAIKTTSTVGDKPEDQNIGGLDFSVLGGKPPVIELVPEKPTIVEDQPSFDISKFNAEFERLANVFNVDIDSAALTEIIRLSSNGTNEEEFDTEFKRLTSIFGIDVNLPLNEIITLSLKQAC
ncbi:hypothetical protein [Photobacterium lutimaris]|uniref:Uncharacterized protein n=1 Tax=Photobacterium lutimaris TaxID=388278 RepID=A0A2T3J4J8_9GAMM|nr:hypothetical protein [Photobacterium lutimaris]PSU36211.1 hypothetical protein C9I99_04210 [Photobacterium lutimaris]TDR74917.1 hypothetical protein DFP78_106248 [Photobacterium lutimaris]